MYTSFQLIDSSGTADRKRKPRRNLPPLATIRGKPIPPAASPAPWLSPSYLWYTPLSALKGKKSEETNVQEEIKESDKDSSEIGDKPKMANNKSRGRPVKRNGRKMQRQGTQAQQDKDVRARRSGDTGLTLGRKLRSLKGRNISEPQSPRPSQTFKQGKLPYRKVKEVGAGPSTVDIF